MRRSLVVGLVVLGWMGWGWTGEQNGRFLLELCQAAMRSFNGEMVLRGDGEKAALCVGYLWGFTEGSQLASAYPFMRPKNELVYCIEAANVSNEQYTRIVVKYLQEYPQRLHLDMGVLVGLALRAAFPCPK